MVDVRMATPGALWKRQQLEPPPAEATHDPTLCCRERSFARDAHAREQQICKTANNRASRVEHSAGAEMLGMAQ